MNESSELDLSSNNLSSILDSFYSGTTSTEPSTDPSSNNASDLNLEKLIQLNEQEELKQINYNDKVMSNLTNNFDIFYSIKSLLSEVSEELKSCVSSISSTKALISSIEQDKEKIDDSLKEEKDIFEARCKETIYLEKVYEIEKLEHIVSLGINVDSFNYLVKMFDDAYSNLDYIKYHSNTPKNTNENKYKECINSIQHSFDTIKSKVYELITKERWRSQKHSELLIKTSLQLFGLEYTKKLIVINCINFLNPFFNDLFKTFKDNVSTYSTDIKSTTVVGFTESIFTFSTLKNINICYKPFSILTDLISSYNVDNTDKTNNDESLESENVFNEEFVYNEYCSLSYNNEKGLNREDIIKEVCLFYSNCINYLNVNIFKTNPLIIFKQFIDVSKNLSKEIGLSERTTLIEFASLVQLTIKNCIKSIVTSWNIEVSVNSEYYLKMDLFDLKEKLKAEMLQNIVFLNNIIKDCVEAFEISGLDDLIFTYIDNDIKDLTTNIFKDWSVLNNKEELQNMIKSHTLELTNKAVLDLMCEKINEERMGYFISKIYIEEIIYFNVLEFSSLFGSNIEYYNEGIKRIQNEIHSEYEKYSVLDYFVLAVFIIRSMLEKKDVLIGYKILKKYIFRHKLNKYVTEDNDDKAQKVKFNCKHEFDRCINAIKLINHVLNYYKENEKTTNITNEINKEENNENNKIDKEKKYKEIMQIFDNDFIEQFNVLLRKEIYKTIEVFYSIN
eukprot:GAHX01001138.1.p1 GENE.GAHX01001138.1~~GAHX01001138.1.p1  ORF type:complete len:730 (-),score=181.08 GAHX01001138.1:35-2224(-)